MLSFNPTSLTFASQVLNTTTTQTVTVTNNGTSPITVTSIVASANFSVVARSLRYGDRRQEQHASSP